MFIQFDIGSGYIIGEMSRIEIFMILLYFFVEIKCSTSAVIDFILYYLSNFTFEIDKLLFLRSLQSCWSIFADI